MLPVSPILAGVRWLTHLHAYATGKIACASTAHQDATTNVGLTGTNSNSPSGVESQEQLQMKQLDLSDGPIRLANVIVAAGGEVDWMTEARKFSTVQQWFHR